MSKGTIIVIAIAFVVLLAGGTFIITMPGRNNNQTASTNAAQSAATDTLQITDEKIGTGPAVKSGDTVTVNYKGTLQNGTVFDSSYTRNQPFTTQIGTGQVIKGWDEGIVGMKVGGKRKLIIPPDLAYGSQGAGGAIPPNATLTFEIELLNIK
jgi:peptidylprolyl isomerase